MDEGPCLSSLAKPMLGPGSSRTDVPVRSPRDKAGMKRKASAGTSSLSEGSDGESALDSLDNVAQATPLKHEAASNARRLGTKRSVAEDDMSVHSSKADGRKCCKRPAVEESIGPLQVLHEVPEEVSMPRHVTAAKAALKEVVTQQLIKFDVEFEFHGSLVHADSPPPSKWF